MRAPITDKHLLEMMWERFPEIMKRGAEQPAQQQEPVAWATQMGQYAHIKWGAKRPGYPMVYEIPLYTSPPAQRKPLTKTKVGNYLRRHAHGEVGMYRNGFKDGVAFAEAAHNIKENT